jgi:triacylglycerol lipase
MPLSNGFTTPEFSIRTAYYLASACQAAYLDELGDWVTELALGERATVFQAGQFHGFVADLENAVLVSLRGTDTIENWLTDGRIIQVEDANYPGKVHRGFADGLRDLGPALKDCLPAATAGRPVWVTGHSLGGALATLAAVRLLGEDYVVRAVYTYGSPRVGDVAFYEGYRPVNSRFVNNNDLVPHVPLETLLVGVPGSGILHFVYKHVGTLKYLNRHGQLGEGMSDWDAKKEFLLGALARTGGRAEPAALADHHITSYVKAIATNLSREA